MLEGAKSSEHELLLSCLTPNQEPERDDQIRALSTSDLDWDYLFAFAKRHSVLPLFFCRLNEVAADLVPPHQMERLQKYFKENTARNILLTAELCELIDILSAAGIEVIPYKGPALSLFAYGSQFLRRFVDLDIMVRRKDVSKAIELILDRGYESSKPLSEGQLRVLLQTQHNVQFRRHNKQLIVELHWEVASHLFASSVQADDLWQNLVEIELNRRMLRSLCAEDQLFSLGVHGSRHLWERLLWICDVAWIAARHNLNWSTLLNRARETNSERMFLLGLQLSNLLLSVRLPHDVDEAIKRDGQLEGLVQMVCSNLFARATHVPFTATQILRYNLKVRSSWSSRARYFRQAIRPTDRDLEAMVLPPSLSFGYYLVRPLRLLFDTRAHSSHDANH